MMEEGHVLAAIDVHPFADPPGTDAGNEERGFRG